MNTITLPKIEYLRLKKQAGAYQKLTSQLFSSIIKDTAKDVIEDFQKTNLYTEDFLKDLEDGIRKSSYLKL